MQENKGRQRCEIYTRVMGYLAPVTRYNEGKKSEFYSRKYFETGNEGFIEKYKNKEVLDNK